MRRDVLVLSPHPDDEAIGCGGTLLARVAEGARVGVVHLTSGEAGGHGEEPAATARRREREAERAAAALGVEAIEFWRERDGALRPTPALVDRLRRTIAAARPALVLAPHPGDGHRDHRAAGRLARAALRALPSRRRPELLGFEIWTPIARLDRIVDITRFAAAKRRAIRCYRSQCAVLDFAAAALGLNRYRGEMFSWPEGEYAEAFRVIEP